MIQALKEHVGNAESRAMDAMSLFGERRGIDWLTYNPLRMRFFHRYAARDAAAVVQSLEIAVPAATRYADVGSGSGAFAAEAIRRGHPTVACERSAVGRWFAKRQGVTCTSFDLTRDPAALLPDAIDLAYSFEVAEHLPPDLGDQLVRFMAQTGAPTIVFSAAQPGQGGTGHINEQPPAYWRERFAASGYPLEAERTEVLRASFAANGVIGAWFADNAMVFARMPT